MKKVLFTIKPHSIVDAITNSSSELFVGKTQNKEELLAFISEAYPNYRNEYEELKNIDEISIEDLGMYFSYTCSPHSWPATKNQYPIPQGFTFDELYAPTSTEPAWNGHIQYDLKHDEHYRFVTKENFEELKQKLDPKKEMYFLFSIDENPDYEMQEELEKFMTRYHLG